MTNNERLFGAYQVTRTGTQSTKGLAPLLSHAGWERVNLIHGFCFFLPPTNFGTTRVMKWQRRGRMTYEAHLLP